MELAAITDEIHSDLDYALSVMAEYGVKNAELRTVWDKNIADAPDEYVERIASVLRARNARPIGLATPFYKCDLPHIGELASGPVGNTHDARERAFDEQIALLRRCIEIARVLDVKLIRTFTFWRKGLLTPEIEDAIVDAYAVPARIAEEAGVTLIIENEHACYIGTGAETARVLEKIGSPNVRAVWDPGNATMVGEKAFPDGYEAIKPFIAHVHIKDVSADEQWTTVGEGIIGYREQFRALKRDGYDGYLSLETHFDLSGSKENASRACLSAMQALLAQT